uniref:Uncharacterized protein n=1 Tax=Anguilla anguilla TaxID=7936 RepID=A0A0E9W839_ANGAN
MKLCACVFSLVQCSRGSCFYLYFMVTQIWGGFFFCADVAFLCVSVLTFEWDKNS